MIQATCVTYGMCAFNSANKSMHQEAASSITKYGDHLRCAMITRNTFKYRLCLRLISPQFKTVGSPNFKLYFKKKIMNLYKNNGNFMQFEIFKHN